MDWTDVLAASAVFFGAAHQPTLALSRMQPSSLECAQFYVKSIMIRFFFESDVIKCNCNRDLWPGKSCQFSMMFWIAREETRTESRAHRRPVRFANKPNAMFTFDSVPKSVPNYFFRYALPSRPVPLVTRTQFWGTACQIEVHKMSECRSCCAQVVHECANHPRHAIRRPRRRTAHSALGMHVTQRHLLHRNSQTFKRVRRRTRRFALLLT